MVSFIHACATMFSDIVDSISGIEFFTFLAAFLWFRAGLAVLVMFIRGTKKL